MGDCRIMQYNCENHLHTNYINTVCLDTFERRALRCIMLNVEHSNTWKNFVAKLHIFG